MPQVAFNVSEELNEFIHSRPEGVVKYLTTLVMRDRALFRRTQVEKDKLKRWNILIEIPGHRRTPEEHKEISEISCWFARQERPEEDWILCPVCTGYDRR